MAEKSFKVTFVDDDTYKCEIKNLSNKEILGVIAIFMIEAAQAMLKSTEQNVEGFDKVKHEIGTFLAQKLSLAVLFGIKNAISKIEERTGVNGGETFDKAVMEIISKIDEA